MLAFPYSAARALILTTILATLPGIAAVFAVGVLVFNLPLAETPCSAEEPKPADKDAVKRAPAEKPASEQTTALESYAYSLKEKEATQSTGPVSVGRKIEVRAAGNATTGFLWSVKEIKGDSVKSGGDVKYVPAATEPKVVGAGGTFVVPLEAVKPGKAEVTLIYARPFEKDKLPAFSVTLTVEVQAAEVAPAKRDKPLTIMGKADPRAKAYIILFENNVDAKGEVERLEKLYAFKHKYVYSMPTFKGFAAEISAEAIEKIRWEPNVKSIERDGVVTTQGAGIDAK